LHFGTLKIESVFGTPGIIPSEFWYVWFIMAHLTFGTPVDELHRLVHCTSWYTKWFFGTVGSLLIVFGTFGTVFTFGTPVPFGALDMISV